MHEYTHTHTHTHCLTWPQLFLRALEEGESQVVAPQVVLWQCYSPQTTGTWRSLVSGKSYPLSRHPLRMCMLLATIPSMVPDCPTKTGNKDSDNKNHSDLPGPSVCHLCPLCVFLEFPHPERLWHSESLCLSYLALQCMERRGSTLKTWAHLTLSTSWSLTSVGKAGQYRETPPYPWFLLSPQDFNDTNVGPEGQVVLGRTEYEGPETPCITLHRSEPAGPTALWRGPALSMATALVPSLSELSVLCVPTAVGLGPHSSAWHRTGLKIETSFHCLIVPELERKRTKLFVFLHVLCISGEWRYRDKCLQEIATALTAL
jgi:hypothetical protein